MALSGASGSGKSTIIQLLERFYDPQSGCITPTKSTSSRSTCTCASSWVWCRRSRCCSRAAWRRTSSTARWARRREEIEEAAQRRTRTTSSPSPCGEGYATGGGQGGGKLSGGQKQRVAIARALIKKPSMLLLDEATSALDNESERVVQAALDEIMKKMKRTTIVIAHRLSTIMQRRQDRRRAEGRIVEEGTYDELLAIGEGVFFQLAAKQEEMGARTRGAARRHLSEDEGSNATVADAGHRDATARRQRSGATVDANGRRTRVEREEAEGKGGQGRRGG